MMQRADTDAQEPGEPGLRQAELFSRGGDALIPRFFLCALESLGVDCPSSEAALAVGTQFPDTRGFGSAALNLFLGADQLVALARVHQVTFRLSFSISLAASSSCSPLA